MSDYKHILVAVDFSSSMDTVLKKACEIEIKNNAKLSLLHVVEYLAPIDLVSESVLSSNWVVNEKELLDQAQHSLETLSKKHSLKNVELFSEVGAPKHEISRFIKAHCCDLLILGSHGRHGLSLLLGSTAGAMLHAMPCDILTIKIE